MNCLSLFVRKVFLGISDIVQENILFLMKNPFSLMTYGYKNRLHYQLAFVSNFLRRSKRKLKFYLCNG